MRGGVGGSNKEKCWSLTLRKGPVGSSHWSLAIVQTDAVTHTLNFTTVSINITAVLSTAQAALEEGKVMSC